MDSQFVILIYALGSLAALVALCCLSCCCCHRCLGTRSGLEATEAALLKSGQVRYTQRFVRIDAASECSGAETIGASGGIDDNSNSGCCSGGCEPLVINTLIVVADASVSGNGGEAAASPSVSEPANTSAASSYVNANALPEGNNTDGDNAYACDDDAHPPLVLVHGFAGSVGLWCKNLTALAAVRGGAKL